jgi:hypothetical protein
MLVTRLRKTRVRLRLVRKGVVICVGSKPLVATSTSIGVNSHEFVSLIRVKETVGSPRKLFFEMFRCCYSGEATAQNNHLNRFFRTGDRAGQ